MSAHEPHEPHGPAATPRPAYLPKRLQPQYDAVAGLTDGFFLQHLHDGDLAACARQMVANLARKRSAPLADGNSARWAAGVVHSVLRVNRRIDDPAAGRTRKKRNGQGKGTGSIADAVALWFELDATSPAAAAAEIDDLLGVQEWDERYATPATLEQSPHNPLPTLLADATLRPGDRVILVSDLERLLPRQLGRVILSQLPMRIITATAIASAALIEPPDA